MRSCASTACRSVAPAGGGSYDGIEIQAPDCTVDGLIITGFSGVGLGVDNPASGFPAQGNWIFANFFGRSPDTLQARLFQNDSVSLMDPKNPQLPPSQQPGNLVAGIRVTSSNNRIGGDIPGMSNVIANNGFDTSGSSVGGVGLLIDTPSGTGNLVQGNAILHNAAQGILVRSSNNTIGEASRAAAT